MWAGGAGAGAGTGAWQLSVMDCPGKIRFGLAMPEAAARDGKSAAVPQNRALIRDRLSPERTM